MITWPSIGPCFLGADREETMKTRERFIIYPLLAVIALAAFLDL